MSHNLLGAVLLSSAVLLFGAVQPLADDQREFHSNAYGFAIDPPQFELEPESPNAIVAQFFLPPEEGFAPNLNIQRQAYAGSVADYAKLSAEQMKSADWNVLESKPGAVGDRETHRFRYQAELSSRDLEFVSLAVRDGDDHILLFTYTVPQERAKDLSKEIESSLASLKFD